MSEFRVGEVIDGDTFKVQNGWKWDSKTGYTVRPIWEYPAHRLVAILKISRKRESS